MHAQRKKQLRKTTMRNGRKSAREADKALCRSTYMMELARGSSYIASTLTPITQRTAIAEVLNGFREQHGADTALIFRDLLAESLKNRKDALAAEAVLNFELH
ncbi:hypothetical protein [Paraburkholderia sp. BL27I4N3]|uniref:hypothetical protein n=1 Tax=Paraburkholderia sp. BL27I4N3 TaxID=1938805 RepID=UPI0021632014|nr:hypothetical protein [Paraburkholderia sp. BL27I4N3]